ncbi:PfkB family carbohydrate kinase [Nonomuraea ferruginea]
MTRFLGETALAGLIFPNRDEALLLSGAATPERAAETLSEHYGTAVVKLGPQGGLVAVGGQVVAKADAVPAEAVDSTGAGDAFAAGYLAAALSGGGREGGSGVRLPCGCRVCGPRRGSSTVRFGHEASLPYSHRLIACRVGCTISHMRIAAHWGG